MGLFHPEARGRLGAGAEHPRERPGFGRVVGRNAVAVQAHDVGHAARLVDGSRLKPAQWKFIEEQAFTGYDNDANMVKIGILNLYLHRLERANVELHNPLTTGKGGSYPGFLFDVILANPPFGGKDRPEVQQNYLAGVNGN